MIEAAGAEVKEEFNRKVSRTVIVDTSVGRLKQAQRLLFLPWKPPVEFVISSDIKVLDRSIASFIQQAIQYAIQGRHKSIGMYESLLFLL